MFGIQRRRSRGAHRMPNSGNTCVGDHQVAFPCHPGKYEALRIVRASGRASTPGSLVS